MTRSTTTIGHSLRRGLGATGVTTPLTSLAPSRGEPQCVQFVAAALCGALHAGHVRSAPTYLWPSTRCSSPGFGK